MWKGSLTNNSRKDSQHELVMTVVCPKCKTTSESFDRYPGEILPNQELTLSDQSLKNSVYTDNPTRSG